MKMWDRSESGNVSGNGQCSVGELFRDHSGFVASFLYRLGVPEADVDDCVQEVFAVAHRKGGFTPGQASARTWLGAIAARVASTSRRTQRRRREEFCDSGVVQPEGAASSAQHAVETRQALDRVQRALDTLDLPHRTVFLLYELEGQDCKDIASALNVAVGTVYSRLHAARRRFLRAHERLQVEEEAEELAQQAHLRGVLP